MLSWINQYVLSAAVPALLMGAGVFFWIDLRSFPLRHPRAILRALTERQTGGVSPFRALTLALAGTLGVGNIVGVSAAIAMGGFGAVFWMWVSALCAMILKYAEIVLAMRHRQADDEGKPHGSAMYYIRACFERLGLPRVGAVLATAFAALCVLNAVSMGSVIQVNAVAEAMNGVFQIPPWITGAVLAPLTLLVIRRGRGSVLSWTERLVPLMTLGYLVLSAAVLILRADRIPDAFAAILSDAKSSAAAAGGVGGFLLSRGVRYGTMRGLISNEAGCGTAPAAHAVSECASPARQGVFGIVEVFVDTLLLCTVTALVVIVSYGETVAREGDFMMMTIRAYSVVLGDLAAYFMSVAVLCFGFATVLCWSHYGTEAVWYLSRKPWARSAFVLTYSLSVMVGALAAADWVWELADFAVGCMTLINVTVLLMAHREIRTQTTLWLESPPRGRTH